MDIGALFSDALTYTQEALVGKWSRWAIFILFALPFSLIQFTFDPKTIMTGTAVDWSAIPWGWIALLTGLGIILSFFISGYIVRIYRGTKPAPDFTGWTSLFIDGVRVAVVWFLWFVPLFIALAAAVAFIVILSNQAVAAPNIIFLLFALLLLLVVFVLFVIIIFFGILGVVRFARTGSIREGIRFSAILTTIRTMGWVSYIILLIGFVIASVVYMIITVILSLIPFIGWVLVIVINPVFMIFTARYFSLVYDQGEPQTPLPAPAVY